MIDTLRLHTFLMFPFQAWRSKWNDTCDNELFPNGTIAVVDAQLMLVPVDVISVQCCAPDDIFPWLHDHSVAFYFWEWETDFLLISQNRNYAITWKSFSPYWPTAASWLTVKQINDPPIPVIKRARQSNYLFCFWAGSSCLSNGAEWKPWLDTNTVNIW